MRLLPRIALLEIGMMVMMDYFCVLLLMNGRPHGNRDLYKCLQHLIRENQGILDDDALHYLPSKIMFTTCVTVTSSSDSTPMLAACRRSRISTHLDSSSKPNSRSSSSCVAQRAR